MGIDQKEESSANQLTQITQIFIRKKSHRYNQQIT